MSARWEEAVEDHADRVLAREKRATDENPLDCPRCRVLPECIAHDAPCDIARTWAQASRRVKHAEARQS